MFPKIYSSCAALFLATLIWFSLCASARATDIPVTTAVDEVSANGSCSLREAITAANQDIPVDACPAGNGADVIHLPAGVYQLRLVGADEDANLTGDLDVTDVTHLLGAAPALTVLDGANLDRVLHVHATAQVTLSGLTLTNGHAPDGADEDDGASGGGILAAGPLTLRDVVVTENAAGRGGDARVIDSHAGDGGHGGGLYATNTVVMTATRFMANRAGDGGTYLPGDESNGAGGDGGWGGGLYLVGSGQIDASHFLGNRAGALGHSVSFFGWNGTGGSGGAIALNGQLALRSTQLVDNHALRGAALASTGKVVIDACDFSENVTWAEGAFVSPPGSGGSSSGPGGAIFHADGALDLVRSTIHHNATTSGGEAGFGSHAHAGDSGAGGGIFNGGEMRLFQSTISNNRTGDGGGDSTWGGDAGSGGAIFNGGELTVEASTIVGNVTGAAGEGEWGDGVAGSGGGLSASTGGTLLLHNTLLAGNRTARGPNDCSGVVLLTGYDFVETMAGCDLHGVSSSDHVGEDALLLPLGDYGGPTLTHLPGFASSVVDAGSCLTRTGKPLLSDQRGVMRPQGGACDIGAVEVAPPISIVYLPLLHR
jgi:CSLREA domain-containing protein